MGDVGHIARREDMSLHAEALDPGRREPLALLFRLGIDVSERNGRPSLAYQHAIPTNRVCVFMEACATVAEQGKSLERDHTGLRHGPRQGGPAATIEVLIGENNASIGPAGAGNFTKGVGKVTSKRGRGALVP